MIRRIWADNYKSLRNFELELRPFNVLVGANGAGKSNLLDVLSFIQDAVRARDGVTGATADRGGWRAVQPGCSALTTVGLSFDLDLEILRELTSEPGIPELALRGKNIDYELWMQLKGTGFIVAEEIVGRRNALSDAWDEISIKRDEAGLLINVGPDVPHYRLIAKLPENRLALGYPISPLTSLAALIDDWQFLHVDPVSARGGTPDVGSRQLDRSGSNLASVLHVLSDEQHESVVSAMRRDVPGFHEFSTHDVGGTLFYTVDEAQEKELPASSISDGTVRLLALYATYYSNRLKPLLCVEEPENGLHPELIETIVEYLRALSEHTQVIITTHSPLLVDWCRPEEVVLLDKIDGATRAVRVPERKQIEQFLRDWTLGELWTRDFLDEIVHNGVGAGGAR